MVGADFFCERGSYRTRSTKTLLFCAKSFYISHAVCYFSETEFEVWADLGLIGPSGQY
jgi:hypothetical protein